MKGHIAEDLNIHSALRISYIEALKYRRYGGDDFCAYELYYCPTYDRDRLFFINKKKPPNDPLILFKIKFSEFIRCKTHFYHFIKDFYGTSMETAEKTGMELINTIYDVHKARAVKGDEKDNLELIEALDDLLSRYIFGKGESNICMDFAYENICCRFVTSMTEIEILETESMFEYFKKRLNSTLDMEGEIDPVHPPFLFL